MRHGGRVVSPAPCVQCGGEHPPAGEWAPEGQNAAVMGSGAGITLALSNLPAPPPPPKIKNDPLSIVFAGLIKNCLLSAELCLCSLLCPTPPPPPPLHKRPQQHQVAQTTWHSTPHVLHGGQPLWNALSPLTSVTRPQILTDGPTCHPDLKFQKVCSPPPPPSPPIPNTVVHTVSAGRIPLLSPMLCSASAHACEAGGKGQARDTRRATAGRNQTQSARVRTAPQAAWHAGWSHGTAAPALGTAYAPPLGHVVQGIAPLPDPPPPG